MVLSDQFLRPWCLFRDCYEKRKIYRKNDSNFLFRNLVNLNQNLVKKWIGIDKI